MQLRYKDIVEVFIRSHIALNLCLGPDAQKVELLRKHTQKCKLANYLKQKVWPYVAIRCNMMQPL